MLIFKDGQNRVHQLDDAAFSHLLPAGCVQITAQEASDLLAPTPEQIAAEAQRITDQVARDAAKADATIAYLVNHTPAECYAKVQADVTDLASAKVMLGRLAMAVSVLARNTLR